MELISPYGIIWGILASTAFLIIAQIRYEKIILDNFSRSDLQSNKALEETQMLRDYNVNIIQVGWIPITGKFATTILFSKSLNCQIYKDFVVFTIKKSYSEYISRVVHKSLIKTKWDIFGGNLISFKTGDVNITCQVYSRIDDFKI